MALIASPALAQSTTVDAADIPGTPAQTATEVERQTGTTDPTATERVPGGGGGDGVAPAVREFVPVLVGGEQSCSGTVRATATADVRRGPLEEYSKIDELEAGRSATACVEEAGFVGIVYGDEGLDCGLARALPEAVAYGGPCRVGWVRADALDAVEG